MINFFKKLNRSKNTLEEDSSSYIEVKGSKHIDWLYPDINNHDNRKDYITLGLTHVRASDDIRIHYDGYRDGWVIEQGSVFEWDIDDQDCNPDWQEVAFIQAWGREEE